MTDGTDAELIAASLTDPSLFGEIFRRHHRTVLTYAMRSVGEQEAPDLAAEIFEEAFKSRRRYDTTYPSARGWLLGIASHITIRYYRRRSKLPTVEYDEIVDTHAGDFSDDAVNRMDARRVLHLAMSALNTEERKVVFLFSFADLSYQQIAGTLDIPEGTVRSRLNRARGKLENFADVMREYLGEKREPTDE